MKTFQTFIVCLLLLCTFNTTIAQDCGFDIKRAELRQNPAYVQLENEAEERIQNAIAIGLSNRSGSSSILTIPVVIHVLHLGEAVGTGTNISDAQIQSSIDNLNDYYRGLIPTSPIDFEIEFTLAQRDPSCNATTGINRIDASAVPNYQTDGVFFTSSGASETTLKDLSRWPETDYFNIWIVTEIDGNNGGSGFQGYANFYNGSLREGSVMMYTVFGYDPTNANPSWPLTFSRDNSTVVHEAGHYFHLYHTFQGDGSGANCPADVTVGTDSDGCADTVPHRRETSTCPANNSCTGNPWVDNNTINNIMSYYYCADRLTDNQRTRVRAAMEGTSLVNSKGSIASDPGYVAPISVCNINTASNTAAHYAGIVNVELNGNSFSSFSTLSDGGNTDVSGNCSNYFEIDADESNILNVTMFTNNWQQLGVWIDWNDDGDFDDDAEQQHLSNDIALNTVVPITISYPVSIPYSDYVRVRLITELDVRYGLGFINSSCYSSLVYGQSEDYTIYVKPAPITYTYNGSWSPSNPEGICTLRDDITIQSGAVNITADTDCNVLTVNPGAGLTLGSSATLCTTTINLNSTSQLFSSFISDGTIIGTINYNRYTSQVGPVGSNDLISAPLSGEAFGTFATTNTNLAASGTLRAFAIFDNTESSIGAYENYDINTNSATTLDAGVGYRAATTDGSTLTYTGNVNTGTVMAPITIGAGSIWNLIGNPYPSYITLADFLTENNSKFDTSFAGIYGYDGDASNGWKIWNFAYSAANSGSLIAPGQGFLVAADAVGPVDVNFLPAMRSSGTTDDFITGRDVSDTNVVLSKLGLTDGADNYITDIYFIDGSTRGLDPGFDTGAFQGNAVGIFTHLVEDNTGVEMGIQSLPYNDFNDVIVPLGIKAIAGVQITIGIDTASTLPTNINVYLEDTVENTWTLLNTTDYTFTPNIDLNGTGRFFLRYSSVTLSTKDTNLNDLIIYATSNPKELVIKGQLNGNATASLYDIQGRLVMTQKLNEYSIINSMNVSSLSTGFYIVKVFNDNEVKTQKLIIK